MKQYTLAHRKDFSGLTLHTDASRPTIQSPTEVLIKIKALSLNARDLQIANGSYPAPHDIPENLVPVSDAAGEVVECGSKVDLWKTGDKVCTVVFQGHDQVSSRLQFLIPPVRLYCFTGRTKMCSFTPWFED
jgi:NADPH:quinone reductase-like Zn-dependent oxidoreductase